MSIATEIERIRADKVTIRNKLVDFGLVGSEATLDACATAIAGIAKHSGISVEILETKSYTIPAGYHDGSGVVKAMTDTAGESEKYKTQTKTVTPTKSKLSVTPDEGNYALSSVIVNPIPNAYQDVSDTTAVAGDVLTGKVYVLADGTVTTGTMQDNGAVKETLDTSTVKYVITAGYHSGTGEVSISLEEKSVTPTKVKQEIKPTSGKVLSKVTVAPIPDAYQDVTPVTAIENVVLEGYAFVNKDGEVIEGTVPLYEDGEVILDVTKTLHVIDWGLHDGNGFVEIHPEEKSVTPAEEAQDITPTAGKVLSKVSVAPIPSNYKDFTGATTEPADVLSGEKFIGAAGTLETGSMPNNGAVAETVDLQQQVYRIPAGYHNGNGTVRASTQTMSATPTKEEQIIVSPIAKLLSEVKVAPIPDAYQDVTPVDAIAADVLDGKTIVAADGTVVEGSMPNNGSTSASIDGLNTMSAAIPAGYTTGGTVTLTDDIENALKAI